MPRSRPKRDYYTLLEVSRNAPEHEIKRAYRRLAFNCHPDRNPNDKTAEERFKEVTEAYSVLGESNRRQKYDALGHPNSSVDDAVQQAWNAARASRTSGSTREHNYVEDTYGEDFAQDIRSRWNPESDGMLYNAQNLKLSKGGKSTAKPQI